jgi:hypothetical protein
MAGAGFLLMLLAVFTACPTPGGDGGTIAVTGVSLDRASLSLYAGDLETPETLTATVSPPEAANKNVTWTSSAETVALVSAGGTVRGIGAGTAVITVTTEDGGKTAGCTVTVTQAQYEWAVTTVAGGTQGYADGAGTDAQFNNPWRITADAAGNLYVADTDNHSIRKIDPLGNVTTVAGDGTWGSADGAGTDARFYLPYGITADAAGNLYVADTFNSRIRKIDPSGNVTTVAGGTAD